jgi:serine/threonine protein kinase
MRFNLNSPIYQSVNEQALDLLKKMLHTNPQERIKAAEILEHPFLSGFM